MDEERRRCTASQFFMDEGKSEPVNVPTSERVMHSEWIVLQLQTDFLHTLTLTLQ